MVTGNESISVKKRNGRGLEKLQAGMGDIFIKLAR